MNTAFLDANTLYYTFSTIAQAGAAAFAFSSAFVLYRLQSCDQRMATAANHLIGQTRMGNGLSNAQGLIAGRQYKALIPSFGASMQVITQSPSMLASWNLLNEEYNISKSLLWWFKLLIWPTAFLLSLSVVSLCVVALIQQSTIALWLIAILSLNFIGLLIIQAKLLLSCLTETAS